MATEKQTAEARSSFGSVQILIMMALFVSLSIVLGKAVLYGRPVPVQLAALRRRCISCSAAPGVA